MKIPSGSTDLEIYFIAVDSTDLKTRLTGLTTFTVYRSRNGSAPAVYTTPTVTELDAVNMPGVYTLLLDEDTALAAGHMSEEYTVHITHAGMNPITRAIELSVFPASTVGTARTYTVTNSVTTLPMAGVRVEISTDLAGSNRFWWGHTRADGVAVDDFNGNLPYLVAGTYYFWKYAAGFTDDDNPDTEVFV